MDSPCTRCLGARGATAACAFSDGSAAGRNGNGDDGALVTLAGGERCPFGAVAQVQGTELGPGAVGSGAGKNGLHGGDLGGLFGLQPGEPGLALQFTEVAGDERALGGVALANGVALGDAVEHAGGGQPGMEVTPLAEVACGEHGAFGLVAAGESFAGTGLVDIGLAVFGGLAARPFRLPG